MHTAGFTRSVSAMVLFAILNCILCCRSSALPLSQVKESLSLDLVSSNYIPPSNYNYQNQYNFRRSAPESTSNTTTEPLTDSPNSKTKSLESHAITSSEDEAEEALVDEEVKKLSKGACSRLLGKIKCAAGAVVGGVKVAGGAVGGAAVQGAKVAGGAAVQGAKVAGGLAVQGAKVAGAIATQEMKAKAVDIAKKILVKAVVGAVLL